MNVFVLLLVIVVVVVFVEFTLQADERDYTCAETERDSERDTEK